VQHGYRLFRSIQNRECALAFLVGWWITAALLLSLRCAALLLLFPPGQLVIAALSDFGCVWRIVKADTIFDGALYVADLIVVASEVHRVVG
jgi:hypothetical protein